MTATLLLMTVVTFRGVTFLEKPLVISPADSGTTYVGEEGAVLCGGVRLGPWTDKGDGVWEADAPKEADGSTMCFDQLWVDGRRADCARLPNKGYFGIVNPHQTVAVTNLDGKATFWKEVFSLTNAEAGVLAKVPADELKYVQLGVIHRWSYARRPLVGYETATRTVTVQSDSDWSSSYWRHWRDETLVSFENVRSAFDAPGEWFLDMPAGKVRYRPRKGERMDKLTIIAPRRGMSRLVEFIGDPKGRRYVENVTFRNIAFENSSFTAPAGWRGPRPIVQQQAASSSDGAVMLTGARNCVFENCRIAHTGNYGMKFVDGCQSNRVVNCTFEDLGAGGIWMGERIDAKNPGRPVFRGIVPAAGVPTAVAFNLISNCTIRAGGKYNPEGTGIALTHCSDTKILHCDIYDMMYSGISVGWSWGFAGSVAQRNEIAFNRIWDLGKGIMSDMGGVYTLGTSFGTVVHDNVVHDVRSYSYGGWALYCDEGSEGIVLERNLCWNTTDGSFMQHYGVGNIVRNNIFAWNRKVGAIRSRREEVDGVPCGFHFLNNIVLVREGPLACDKLLKKPGIWRDNVWYDVRGKAAAVFDLGTWEQFVASGREEGGVFADPLFVDAERFDFRLKPASPALKLGFKPWDWSQAGRNRSSAVE